MAKYSTRRRAIRRARPGGRLGLRSRDIWEPSWFELPPDLWVDRGAPERRRTLRELLRELRAARARGDEWIRWIDAGCPSLSEEEYARACRARRGGGRKL
jgi:hypothetical protein